MNNDKDTEYNEFIDQLLSVLRGLLPEHTKLEIRSILKNNDLHLDALTIMEPGETITPNFYLQHYYPDYQEGTSLESIAQDILNSRDHANSASRGVSVDVSFKACKSQIIYRLISEERNRELLQTVPYVPFLDLAIIFYCVIQEGDDGICSLRVTNTLLEDWKIKVKDLLQLAAANTARLFPVSLTPLRETMEDLIFSMRDQDDDGSTLSPEELFPVDLPEDYIEPYVMSNTKMINGAATVLYPDALHRAAQQLGHNLYILPSSIHEVMLIADTGDVDQSELQRMVQEVNETCVCEEEILSDQVYYFDRHQHTIHVLSQNTVENPYGFCALQN